MSHKPLKVTDIKSVKKLFSSVYVIDTTCLDECLLFHVIIEKNLASPRALVGLPCCCVLETKKKCFERESACYVYYLHNNITILQIPKV